MKEKVSKNAIVDGITQAIIDGGKDSFRKLITILNNEKYKKHFSGSLLEGVREKESINFIIFKFFLELQVLKNTFEKEIADEFKNMSIELFAQKLKYDKDKLIKEIEIYEKKFDEDIGAGINPFDSLGILAILCEKLKFKKTVDIGGTKWFDPILIQSLNSFVGPTGMWKKAKELYEINE